MNEKQYRDKFRAKAKVRLECNDCPDCDSYSILCPLPFFLGDAEIKLASHVCTTAFEEGVRNPQIKIGGVTFDLKKV